MCYDALKALTQHYLLTVEQERQLLSSLPLAARCQQLCNTRLVTSCYQTKLNKCAVNELNESNISVTLASTTSTASTTTVTATTIPATTATAMEDDKSPVLPNVNTIEALPTFLTKLNNNLDIITAKAERLYYKCNFVLCFQLTRTVLEQDPYHTECLPTHIACLLELRQSNTLFLLAHKLVDLYPETALAWFAVGAYYYLIGKNEHARRYLSKATTIDKVFGPAWIAFAHSFAAENEHDQASAAYFKVIHIIYNVNDCLCYLEKYCSITLCML